MKDLSKEVGSRSGPLDCIGGILNVGRTMSDKGYELSTLEKQAEFAKQRNKEPDYDVVIDTLQQKRDTLWKMTQENINADRFNVMDQIRLEQISQLERAIELWHWRDDGK
jgi:hypothetical protein